MPASERRAILVAAGFKPALLATAESVAPKSLDVLAQAPAPARRSTAGVADILNGAGANGASPTCGNPVRRK